MRKVASFLIFLLTLLPLHATPIQRQADHAQNLLEETLYRITHAWIMMQYHFEKGNQRLMESADSESKNFQKNLPLKQ